MITEKTISTWMEEFNKSSSSDDSSGTKPLEAQTLMQSNFFTQEPIFAAMVSTLFGVLKINNPLSASFYSLCIYHECLRRQQEADKLGREIG